MRRVVVTGAGLVTPLGVGVDHVWSRLVAGDSGVGPITAFDPVEFPSKIAGQVPRGSAPHELDVDATVPKKEQRRMDSFIVYALAASDEAVARSGWRPTDSRDLERTGVLIGSGIGGFSRIAETALTLRDKGPRRISPFFIPSMLINEAAGHVAMRHGFKGPNHAVVTACASGAHALGDAARMIQLDDADVMVAGGSEAGVVPLALAGFSVMRAVSHGYNDRPTEASRPWDRDRDGFVLGEGAGLVVLEELEHARRRGASILGEVLGYGMSGDAHHISAPDPTGDGVYRAMRAALERARLAPEDIDYVNAHATSTPLGDSAELVASERLFGEHAARLAMSSTKSSVGHLLGAAGAVEAIFTLLALKHGAVPPTLNLYEPDPATPIDLVALEAQERPLRHAMSNSFGFGGTNAVLVLGPAP